MADETLRMAAEIVDKWSGPLKSMTQSMKNFGDLTKKAHVEGGKQARDHEGTFKDLRTEMVKLTDHAKNIMGPAFSEVGLGFVAVRGAAAGVGAAIAGAIASVKKFGDTAPAIISVSNQTKLMRQQVVEWQIAGAGFGKTTDEMNQSLVSFATLMDQTNRRAPQAFTRWQQMPGLLEALGGDQFTHMTDRNAQMRQAIDRIKDWKADPDKKRTALAILGLPEDITSFSKEQIDAFFKAANEAAANKKIDWDKGLDAKIAIEKLKGQFGGAMDEIASKIVGAVESPGGVVGSLRKSMGLPEEGYPLIPQGMNWLRDRFKGENRQRPPIIDAPPFETEGGAIMRGPNTGRRSELLDFEKAVERGSEKGVFAGMKQYASFGLGGEAPTVIPAAGGGGGGFVGGGRHKVYVGGDTAPGAGEGMAGSEYLKARRQRFAQEMSDNPALRDELAAVVSMEHESDPTAVSESLFNRMDYSKGTVQSGLRSGFYGPANRGLVPGRMAELRRDLGRMSRINRGIDAALGGSNLIQGATDQGSGNDPNAGWSGGRITRHREIYNDWGGGPGGHEGARQFRERQQRAVREGQGRSSYPAGVETFGPPRPSPLQEQMSGKQSLLDNARGAGVFGKIGGSASIDISLDGFPKGIKTAMSSQGLFKEVKLNRGASMAVASEDQ